MAVAEAIPPARHDRQRCWETRDSYFACLDSAKTLVAGEEGDACAQQRKDYEKNCAKSWIDYFNTRRVLAEQQKESLRLAQAQADARRSARRN